MKKLKLLLGTSVLLVIATIACKNNTSKSQSVQKVTNYSTSLDFERNVMQILDQSPDYNSFLKLVNLASYFDELNSMDGIMVFVPADEAFGPSLSVINELGAPENLGRLNSILQYHIVKGEYDAQNLINTIKIRETPLRLQTVHGGYLAIKWENGKLKILDENSEMATIKESSIKGANGIVFAIDKILMPRKQTEIISKDSTVTETD